MKKIDSFFLVLLLSKQKINALTQPVKMFDFFYNFLHNIYNFYERKILHQLSLKKSHISIDINHKEFDIGIVSHKKSHKQEFSKKIIFYIHGIGGTSNAFYNVIHYFHDNYDYHVFSIELPFYNEIQTKNSDYFNVLQSMSIDDLMNFYALCIKKTIDHIIEKNENKQEEIILTCQSLGSYICTHFMILYPNFVDKFICLNAIGLFPIICPYNNYWLILFKYGFPYSLAFVYNILGTFLFFIFLYHIGIISLRSLTNYLLISQKNIGTSIVKKCVQMSYDKMGCSRPLITFFIELYKRNQAIYFIFGEEDFLVSQDHADLLIDIFKDTSFTFIIPKSKHMPYLENPNYFCKVIDKIVHLDKKNTKLEQRSIIDENEIITKMQKMTGSFIPKNVQKQFSEFIEIKIK